MFCSRFQYVRDALPCNIICRTINSAQKGIFHVKAYIYHIRTNTQLELQGKQDIVVSNQPD